MSISALWRRVLGGRAPKPSETVDPGVPRKLDVRISGALFARVRAHVEDFSHGEEAGFLICSLSQLADRDILVAREWIPVPEEQIGRGENGSVLSWSAQFNSDVLARAGDIDCTPVLVHSHGSAAPRFSGDDRRKERPLFGAFSRILREIPTGTLLVGQGDVVGSFWLDGCNEPALRALVIAGDTIDVWPAGERPVRAQERSERLSRQSLAIGPASEHKLVEATVAILGLSGGGSHVVQQLAHQGVGTLIVIDDELVEKTNLGRLVGAREEDIDRTLKVDVAWRVATGVDREIEVVRVPERFPSQRTIDALKEADVIVACLDRFDARAAVNAFARRYLIPLVDIGMTIRSNGEQLASANGQLIVTIPGKPCMRCWFLTDALLAKERTERPPGYDRNPDRTGDPQVVSMNGVLASEAVNGVLDMITGYSGGRRGAEVWRYDGRAGELAQCELPTARAGCPACAEEGHGDPICDGSAATDGC
jgi:molybdopterin/thiamine biosynthesis adenylyltransferase